MRTAILGATGYTGLLLYRLLAEHPAVTDIIPVSSSQPGARLSDIDRRIDASAAARCASTGGKLVSIDDALGMKIDVVFAALPHIESAKICSRFAGRSVIIDLSADFRYHDVRLFEAVYGAQHPVPGLLESCVYGLTEWYRDRVKKSDLIANPGCYPTATLLPLLPLLKQKLITGRMIANALSGISGAGKKVQLNYLFCERTENTGAYSPGTMHRHASEIQKELVSVDPSATLLFTPHLVPLKRGMTVTTVAPLARAVDAGVIRAAYASQYGRDPFVRIVDGIPQSADVRGSNRCDIGFHLEEGVVMLFSAIDNLMKGASGQAIQNMNVRFGLAETDGLSVNGDM